MDLSSPPRSVLNSLPYPDKVFVWNLLDNATLAAVQARLRNPRPFGLSINVSASALQRFHSCHLVAEIVETHDIVRDESKSIFNLATENEEQFLQASRHLLKLRLIKTALSPVGSLADLRDLYKILDRLRQTDLAERRLALAEKKLQQTKTQ